MLPNTASRVVFSALHKYKAQPIVYNDAYNRV